MGRASCGARFRVERGEEMHVIEGLIGRSNFEDSSNKEARERERRATTKG